MKYHRTIYLVGITCTISVVYLAESNVINIKYELCQLGKSNTTANLLLLSFSVQSDDRWRKKDYKTFKLRERRNVKEKKLCFFLLWWKKCPFESEFARFIRKRIATRRRSNKTHWIEGKKQQRLTFICMKFGEYVQLKHHPKGFLLWKRCFFFNCFLFVLKASCVFRCYSSTTPNAIRIRFWLAVHESHVSYDFQSIPFEGIVYVAYTYHTLHFCYFFSLELHIVWPSFNSKQIGHISFRGFFPVSM